MKTPTKAQRQAWAKLIGRRGGLIGGKSTSPAKVAAVTANLRKARAAKKALDSHTKAGL